MTALVATETLQINELDRSYSPVTGITYGELGIKIHASIYEANLSKEEGSGK